ncbi:hypothetical protein BaRGS_00011015 [Batillaria attramentaria]|uniref:Uncharacterized protein n=1 Tax=Batillaria attramentaria TaxID=370345 RepID=A0ABD0LE54_9CAEN
MGQKREEGVMHGGNYTTRGRETNKEVSPKTVQNLDRESSNVLSSKISDGKGQDTAWKGYPATTTGCTRSWKRVEVFSFIQGYQT